MWDPETYKLAEETLVRQNEQQEIDGMNDVLEASIDDDQQNDSDQSTVEHMA